MQCEAAWSRHPLPLVIPQDQPVQNSHRRLCAESDLESELDRLGNPRSPHLLGALAHYALAPALEGVSPTPELPEIAEAQSLLEALSVTDDATARAAAAKLS